MTLKSIREMSAADIGCSLHTALRKCCDSHNTSLAYNAVWCCNKGWRKYTMFIKDRFSKVYYRKDIVPAMKAANHDSVKAIKPNPETFTIFLILQLFTENEWEAFASYFLEK